MKNGAENRVWRGLGAWCSTWIRWPRLRHDNEAGQLLALDELRWFQWGLLTRRGEGAHAWYWLLRLPVFEMRLTDYERGEPVMHQRCLVFVEPLSGPYGEHDGLQFMHFACRPVL